MSFPKDGVTRMEASLLGALAFCAGIAAIFHDYPLALFMSLADFNFGIVLVVNELRSRSKSDRPVAESGEGER